MRETYSPDRRYFFSSLKQPLFLWRHAGFLAASVAGRLLTRLRLARRTAHQGSKRWPAAVLRERNLRDSAPEGGLRLPRYAVGVPSEELVAKRVAESREFEAAIAADRHDDTEAYFAEHRWGWLLDAMLTAEPDDAALFGRVESWISAHRNREARCWETYSACERVVNSLTFLASLPEERASALSSPLYRDFVAGSLAWIYRHLEYYGGRKTNNHLFNNARALVAGGVALRNDAAVDAGMRLFRAFLPRMVSDGGFLRERSSHYQLVVLHWLLDAWKFMACRDGGESGDVAFLLSYAERMAAAARMLTDASGEILAAVGDVSPDFTPLQSSLRFAMLFPEFDLSGASAEAAADGWYRRQSDTGVVLGNCMGGTYPPAFPTHGHNDLVSFVWLEGGEAVLADPGRARYTPDAVSLLQKSAAGHNVPLVNGFAPFCETLIPNGQWWPVPYARAAVDLSLREGGVLISHDGFSRSTPVSAHRRSIDLRPGGLAVEDLFEGAGTVEVEWLWHFGSAFDAFDGERMVVRGATGREVRIRVMDAGSCQAVPLEGRSAEPLKVSPCYGVERPSLGVGLRLAVKLPAAIRTEFTVTACAG